jgi:hypothetical protein
LVVFTECRQRNVFFVLNGSGNRTGHSNHCKR